LVVNHTSIDHPWFQEARRDKNSKFRNWYVWSKEKPANAEQGMAFPGVQKTTWTFDEQAGEYYYHRFYNHQPDLNTGNPAVRAFDQGSGQYRAGRLSGIPCRNARGALMASRRRRLHGRGQCAPGSDAN